MDKKLGPYVYDIKIHSVIDELWSKLEYLKPLMYEHCGNGFGDKVCPLIYSAQNMLLKIDQMAYEQVDEKELDTYLDEQMDELELNES